MNLAALRTLLVKHEGLRLFPYNDTVGKITIGIGHNLTDLGVSEDIVEKLFTDDVSKVIAELDKFPWFTRLDDIRQMVITDMAFNLGVEGLLKFHLMIAALQVHNYEEAAHQMLNSKWAQQVGMRANELANMMIEGAHSGS